MRSRLNHYGIPAVYQENGDLKKLQKNGLAVSLHLRKLDVDTAGPLVSPFFV